MGDDCIECGACATVRIEQEETAIRPCWDRCRDCEEFIGGNSVRESHGLRMKHLEDNPICGEKDRQRTSEGFEKLLKRLKDSE